MRPSEYYVIMSASIHNETIDAITAFLREIGIGIECGVIDEETFLPGIDVVNGSLVFDESKLLYQGDLLHEAGHLAVTPAKFRKQLSGTVETVDRNPDVIETAAICWSYAACIHIGLDPAVVFHEHGYRGRSASLLLGFDLGMFPGVQELVSAGMTLNKVDAERLGLPPFPVMQKWLRD